MRALKSILLQFSPSSALEEEEDRERSILVLSTRMACHRLRMSDNCSSLGMWSISVTLEEEGEEESDATLVLIMYQPVPGRYRGQPGL